MLTKLSHVMCMVTNMDASVAFYRDVCGLKPKHTSEHWSEFYLGDGSLLALHPVREGHRSGERLGQQGKGWTLEFLTEDLASVRKRLQTTKVNVAPDYHEIPGGVLLSFEDPDGNPIDVGQMGISLKDLEK